MHEQVFIKAGLQRSKQALDAAGACCLQQMRTPAPKEVIIRKQAGSAPLPCILKLNLASGSLVMSTFRNGVVVSARMCLSHEAGSSPENAGTSPKLLHHAPQDTRTTGQGHQRTLCGDGMQVRAGGRAHTMGARACTCAHAPWKRVRACIRARACVHAPWERVRACTTA